jgi:hypothetical protein
MKRKHIKRQHKARTYSPQRPKQNSLGQTFRSNFEYEFAEDLIKRSVPYEYELARVHYEQRRMYKPDFVLDNGIIIETKGWFKSADRTKHKLIKKQHPELDIRFIFMNPDAKGEGSKVTNAEWCKKNGFKYARMRLPKDWEDEKND